VQFVDKIHYHLFCEWDALVNQIVCFPSENRLFPAPCLLRCREDVPKPHEESSVISAASSGHLIEEEAEKEKAAGGRIPAAFR